MTDANAATPRAPEPEAPAHAWRDVAAILALLVLVAVPQWFTRDLWNPDEPRYTEIAREMVELGDYAVAHLNGEVYPDKPALFFWMSAGLRAKSSARRSPVSAKVSRIV